MAPYSKDELDVTVYPLSLPFYLVIDMVSETEGSRVKQGEEDEKAGEK